jgi:hypothetical protein
LLSISSLLLSISSLVFSLFCQNEGEFYEYKFSDFTCYYELIFCSFLYSNIFTKPSIPINLSIGWKILNNLKINSRIAWS